MIKNASVTINRIPHDFIVKLKSCRQKYPHPPTLDLNYVPLEVTIFILGTVFRFRKR
jgi:hypothetical protein